MMKIMVVMVFFFLLEDGVLDSLYSRGLGDVFRLLGVWCVVYGV